MPWDYRETLAGTGALLDAAQSMLNLAWRKRIDCGEDFRNVVFGKITTV